MASIDFVFDFFVCSHLDTMIGNIVALKPTIKINWQITVCVMTIET
jgi:hypothetical protein